MFFVFIHIFAFEHMKFYRNTVNEKKKQWPIGQMTSKMNKRMRVCLLKIRINNVKNSLQLKFKLVELIHENGFAAATSNAFFRFFLHLHNNNNSERHAGGRGGPSAGPFGDTPAGHDCVRRISCAHML